MDILSILKERGIFKDITSLEKFSKLDSKVVYIGFDPSGESLHLGNYIQIVVLKWFQKCGFKSIAVIGGATGAIGDPSGRSTERKLIDNKELIKNKNNIVKQLISFNFQVVDNLSFYSRMKALDFLKNIGKYVNISHMINKEVIKSRLEGGISFTEFSYQLIQGWDFKELYEKYGVSVQVGGSDQWGNIVTGVDLIKKFFGDEAGAIGITTNLLLKSDGTKFGKSEGWAIWLNKKLTSPFKMYQFLLTQTDNDVKKLLKWLTFFSIDDINEIMEIHFKEPNLQFAQKKLAEAVVADIHSIKEADLAKRLTDLLYNDKNIISISGRELSSLESMLPKIWEQKIKLLDALLKFDIAKSNREARELIHSGSIRVNGVIIKDPNKEISRDPSFFNGKFSILKKGKRYNYLISHKHKIINAKKLVKTN